MTVRVWIWYRDRSLRERRLLTVMTLLALVTFVWAGIIRPVNDGLSSARARHASAVIRLGETQARLDALRTIQRDRPAPLAGPIDAVLRLRANEAGFALANATPQGADAVQLSITAARPGALIAWIADLENAGILVESLTLSNNGNQTVAAQMTVRARGI